MKISPELSTLRPTDGMRDSTRDPNRVDSGRNPGGGTDFRKALAHANVRSVMDRTTPAPLSGGNGNRSAPGATYVVRNGDTMTGIAQKLLAARGQEAGPQASLRAALQLARANGISNPDRIRPGQTIDTNLLAQGSGNSNGFSNTNINTSNTQSNRLSSRSLAAPQQFSHASQALKGLRPVNDRSSAPLNHHPVLEKTLDRAVSLQYFDASQKDAVRDKVMQLARQHQFSPDDLAIVTLIESDGMNPRATNGRCHGVIQFCDGPNRGAATVGFADNPKGILNLSVLDQLDLMGKYFEETGLRQFGPATLDNLYLTVLTPAARRERSANTSLDIAGQQATALYEGNDRNGGITRNSLLNGLYQNARDKLAMSIPAANPLAAPASVNRASLQRVSSRIPENHSQDMRGVEGRINRDTRQDVRHDPLRQSDNRPATSGPVTTGPVTPLRVSAADVLASNKLR
jgi:LysM repeat protein